MTAIQMLKILLYSICNGLSSLECYSDPKVEVLQILCNGCAFYAMISMPVKVESKFQ
jgi:hypothetical protein